MTNEIADYVSVKLASPFDPASDTTVDVVATNSIYEMVDQKTTNIFQDFRLSIFEKTDISQKITVAITSAVANGTLGGLNRYTLTILDSDSANSMIGLANTDDGTDADANIIAGNVSSLTISEFSTDSVCMIKVGSAEYNEMKSTFDAGNTSNTVTEGEVLTELESVSLHTDGKTYKYHATNYPNLVGVQTSTTGKYITFGGLSTGHSGLTVGATQYAEETGAITETPSTTTKYLGVAETATSIRIAPSTPNALEAASQAEAEAGTENTKYTTSLRVKQATTADTTLIKTTGAQSIAGVKTYTDSPIVPTPTTDMQASTKKYVDDAVPADTDLTLVSNKLTTAGISKGSNSGAFSEVVAHGLARTPKYIMMFTGDVSSTKMNILHGTEWLGSAEMPLSEAGTTQVSLTSVTLDATNVTLNMTQTGTGTSSGTLSFMAFA